MTQKEKALLTLKAILVQWENKDADELVKFLDEKINACLDLQRPEVLLSEKERRVFEKLVEEFRRSGKII